MLHKAENTWKYKPSLSVSVHRDMSGKWTSRGTSQCPRCAESYSNAWKPKNCKNCNFEIGGNYVPKAKKRKVAAPQSVLVVDSSQIKIFSVKLNYRESRTFVVKSGENELVCHHKKCKDRRAVHMASNLTSSFSCGHTEAVNSSLQPPSAKNLTPDDVAAYKCDGPTREQLTKHLNPLEDFRHIVQVSDDCYAVYTGPSTSNPTGYCHCERQPEGYWSCCGSTCNRKTGASKQLKTRALCMHLHILYCVIKDNIGIETTPPNPELSSPNPDLSSPQYCSNSLDPEKSDLSMSVSRRSSLTLALKRSIPYPVPSHILQACRRQSFPGVIVPSCSICDLCGSSLTTGQQHPGRALNDPSYILTPWSLTQVNVLVKFCSSKDCKAMHQAWPIDQGMCYRILSLCPMFFFLCYS